MTFDAQETSQSAGEPIELYEFRIGTAVSRFTTSEDEYTVGGDTYTPAIIQRTRITVGPEQRDDVIQLDVPSDQEIVRQYINIPPGARAEVDISRIHRSDVNQEVIMLFRGVLQTVGFDLLGYRARIGVAPLTESLSRTVPRFTFSAVCNHVLYGGQCSVNNALHRVESSITAVDGSDARLITIPGIVTDIGNTARGTGTARIDGGYLTIDGVSYRSIREGVGNDQIRLFIPFASDVTGETAEVFAGCAHDLDDCENVFLNIEGQSGSGGYGGYAWIPRENIFSKGIT